MTKTCGECASYDQKKTHRGRCQKNRRWVHSYDECSIRNGGLAAFNDFFDNTHLIPRLGLTRLAVGILIAMGVVFCLGMAVAAVGAGNQVRRQNAALDRGDFEAVLAGKF